MHVASCALTLFNGIIGLGFIVTLCFRVICCLIVIMGLDCC